MSSNRRLRNWCFTVNNYDSEYVKKNIKTLPHLKYAVVGRETGKEGTPHLQGYVEFSSAIYFNKLRSLLPGAHIEGRLGTRAQASEYCKKDGDFIEFGKFTPSGKRTDLDQVRDALDSGSNTFDIAQDYFGPWCKYRKSFEEYANMVGANEMRDPLEVLVYFGSAGTGKTYKAVTENKDYFILSPGNSSNVWFDGYYGQDVLIIDDYDGDWIKYRPLLRILDRYPYALEVKGSRRYAKWRKVIITTNIHPREWFAHLALSLSSDFNKTPLGRRITDIVEFK